METKKSFILNAIKIVFWITFIGLCLKTGAILTSAAVSYFINPVAAKNLYSGLNLFDLYSYDRFHYSLIVFLLLLLTGLKAFMAYLIVKFFIKFRLSKPFSNYLSAIFMRISHVALATGIVAIIANGYTKWIFKMGITIPIDWGNNEILFFAGIIYLLALVYRTGTDLQIEKDLTI